MSAELKTLLGNEQIIHMAVDGNTIILLVEACE
jgi:hypothetical protein